MNDLQKELQELKAKVADLESRIVAEPVAKWQPKGGYWQVDCEGDVVAVDSFSPQKEFGTSRDTQAQAQRASVEMRRFNRLLALRDELCGDEVRHVYEISFDTEDKKWVASDIGCFKAVTVGFEQERHAQRACDMLNSGEVEL